jgi:hypothetical protein
LHRLGGLDRILGIGNLAGRRRAILPLRLRLRSGVTTQASKDRSLGARYSGRAEASSTRLFMGGLETRPSGELGWAAGVSGLSGWLRFPTHAQRTRTRMNGHPGRWDEQERPAFLGLALNESCSRANFCEVTVFSRAGCRRLVSPPRGSFP